MVATMLMPDLAKAFGRNHRGNVAILFGLALIPIAAALGGAVDYSNAARTRSQLRDIFDAAALAGATAHAQSDRIDVVQRYVRANSVTRLGNQQIENLKIAFDDVQSTVTVSGDVNLKMMIMSVLGHATTPVANTSTAVWGGSIQRISLVLDTTGSLRNSGVDCDLRTAATNFIDTISGNRAKTSNLFVSLVPFASMVNVGADKTAWLSSKYNAADYLPAKWDGCVYERAQPNDVTAKAPVKGEFDPHIWPKNFSAVFGFNDWASAPASKFKNGVSEPVPAYDEEQTLLGPNVGCMAPVIPLTTDMQAVKSRIQDLVMLSGSGGTNLAEGIVWGWRTLVPDWAEFWRGGTPQVQDKMSGGTLVFLSDGANDWYMAGENGVYRPYYYGLGITTYGRPEERRSGIGPFKSAVQVAAETLGTTPNDPQLATKIAADRADPYQRKVDKAVEDSDHQADKDAQKVWDDRFLAVCNAIKASGITIYTIAFGPDDNGTNVMRKCATSTKHFFDSPNKNDLEAAFKEIAGSLGNQTTVRLAR
jgi:Flp pilus assembly protein TadG